MEIAVFVGGVGLTIVGSDLFISCLIICGMGIRNVGMGG